MILVEQSRTQGSGGQLRRAVSLLVSAGMHGGVLGWVALGPAASHRPAQSLYEQVIRPNQQRLVWYDLRDRLPEVAPRDRTLETSPPRALRKHAQTVVAEARGARGSDQMIWAEGPKIDLDRPLPSPN